MTCTHVHCAALDPLTPRALLLPLPEADRPSSSCRSAAALSDLNSRSRSRNVSCAVREAVTSSPVLVARPPVMPLRSRTCSSFSSDSLAAASPLSVTASMAISPRAVCLAWMYDSFASLRVTMSSWRSSAAFADRRPSSTVILSKTTRYRRRCASIVRRYRFTSSSVSCAVCRCAMAAYRLPVSPGRKSRPISSFPRPGRPQRPANTCQS